MSEVIKAFQPIDVMALILSLGLSITLIITAVGIVVFKIPISDERAKSMGDSVRTLIAVLAVYVGAKLNGGP